MTTPAPLPDPHATPPIADSIRHLANKLALRHLPSPSVQVQWHQCDDDQIRAVVAAFPGVAWRTVDDGANEWLSGRDGGIEYTVFARSPERVPTSRLAALLNGDLDMAMARARADEAAS